MLKRRFIAGAVCPRCAGMDKIVMYDADDGTRYRECVSCGFREPFTYGKEAYGKEADGKGPDGQDAEGLAHRAEEIKTRVNSPRIGEKTLPHETEVQVVKFVDAGIKRQDH